MHKRDVFIIIALIALAGGYYLLRPASTGILHLYDDLSYHYESLRALSHTAYSGGEANEVLVTIARIPAGDDEAWFTEWESTAKCLEKAAQKNADPISRGNALLRSHNYYRTAEFYLLPDDPRRLECFKSSKRTFYEGLKTLSVPYEKFQVDYGQHKLNAVYYSAGQQTSNKPLILACGGYDSTLEELYFTIAAAALARGYDCLTFEGPGQGSVIREQNLQFTPKWEKPTAALLDEFLKRHPGERKIN